jgi:hypothetical protein
MEMYRRLLVAVLGGLVVSLLLVASGSSSPRALSALDISFAGPTKGVVPGTSTRYVLSVKNTGNRTIGRVTLRVDPADVIAHSSVPYKRTFSKVYRSYVAYWNFKNFKPSSVFKRTLILKFPPGDFSRYSIIVDAVGQRPYAFKNAYLTVNYRPSP